MVRRIKLCILLLCATYLVSCSGGGSGARGPAGALPDPQDRAELAHQEVNGLNNSINMSQYGLTQDDSALISQEVQLSSSQAQTINQLQN